MSLHTCEPWDIRGDLRPARATLYIHDEDRYDGNAMDLRVGPRGQLGPFGTRLELTSGSGFRYTNLLPTIRSSPDACGCQVLGSRGGLPALG